jgi:type 1 glutamine amidotransferase
MLKLLEPLRESPSYSLAVSDKPNEGDIGDLSSYELLILGAMGQLAPKDSPERWLTPAGEERVVEYVENGGGVVILHSALAGYPTVGPLRDLVRGHFKSHPKDHPIITIRPVDRAHPVVADIEPFQIKDEQYFVEVDLDRTDILAEGQSAEHGTAPAAWAHEVGHGRVCVLTPGHNEEVVTNASMQRLLTNAVDWVLRRT